MMIDADPSLFPDPETHLYCYDIAQGAAPHTVPRARNAILFSVSPPRGHWPVTEGGGVR